VSCIRKSNTSYFVIDYKILHFASHNCSIPSLSYSTQRLFHFATPYIFSQQNCNKHALIQIKNELNNINNITTPTIYIYHKFTMDIPIPTSESIESYYTSIRNFLKDTQNTPFTNAYGPYCTSTHMGITPLLMIIPNISGTHANLHISTHIVLTLETLRPILHAITNSNSLTIRVIPSYINLCNTIINLANATQNTNDTNVTQNTDDVNILTISDIFNKINRVTVNVRLIGILRKIFIECWFACGYNAIECAHFQHKFITIDTPMQIMYASDDERATFATHNPQLCTQLSTSTI